MSVIKQLSHGSLFDNPLEWAARMMLGLPSSSTFDHIPPVETLPVGTNVKTLEIYDIMPLCGRLAVNTENEAVVIGHGWADMFQETFVWKGTRDDLIKTWTID